MEKNMKRWIETLIGGRDSAKRLQNQLRRKVNDEGSDSVDDLLMNILGSFSDVLSEVSSCSSAEFCGVPPGPPVVLDLGCPVDPAPDRYTGKKPPPTVKERRGCYKRRKTIDSRIKVSGTIEDGYAWRKYGQKEILKSKFPRCYFRCTHKNTHGCKALKQVQKLEDDESNKFEITYFSHHTCPNPHSGVILDFKDFKNHHYSSTSPSTITNIHIDPLVKQEDDSKAQSDGFSDILSSANDVQSTPCALWNEILGGDLNPCHEDASFMGFDHEDSCASTSSHGFLGMDFLRDDGFFDDIQSDLYGWPFFSGLK